MYPYPKGVIQVADASSFLSVLPFSSAPFSVPNWDEFIMESKLFLKKLSNQKNWPKKNKLTVISQISRKMTAKSVDNQPASLIMRVMMRGFRHEEVCVCC